jgi:hypothetical protein
MKTSIATLAIVLSASALGACSSSGNNILGATATDRQFGNSVREARLRQTIDMNAGSKHADTGSDAQSGTLAVKRYHDSFKRPVRQPSFKVLGIGD